MAIVVAKMTKILQNIRYKIAENIPCFAPAREKIIFEKIERKILKYLLNSVKNTEKCAKC